MKKIILLFLVFSYLSIGLSSAQNTPLRIDYSPKSPEVSTLFDFTDIAVGNYTGSAGVNIPISNLTSGPLSTSVSLSYNSSGNKVSQRATWVGLGWNLNAGGIITREVRGIADDYDAPIGGGVGFLEFIQSYSSVNQIFQLGNAAKFNLYEGLSSFGCKDAEPDVFTFSVGELSGKFMFDWDGAIKVACNRNIEVSYTQSSGNNGIDHWTITDDKGNVYVFSKKETNDITGILGMGAGACSTQPYTASWKLTSMEDHSGQHRIDFVYEDYFMEYPVEYSKQHTINLAGGHLAHNIAQSGFDINGSYISTISVANSQDKIEFIKSTNQRTDVSGTNLFPLGSILLKDNTSIVNEFQFEYTLSNRLKLDGINRINGTTSLPYYIFDYSTTPLPSYNSKSTDHWGYYNGASNGSDAYPSFIFRNFPNNHLISLPGADKKPNATNCEAEILKKITYPTKGYTEFTYENHDYSFIQSNQIPSGYGQNYMTPNSSTLGLGFPARTV